MLEQFGKYCILAGLTIAGIGLLCILGAKGNIPYLGKLPGDILIEKKNFIFYFPLTTSIIISIIVTLVLFLLSRK